MAVHIPLTEEARWEARNLMLSTKNLLKPATGAPIVRPDKDIAWGCYYMTTMDETEGEKVRAFGSPKEAMYVYQAGKLSVRAKIKVKMHPEDPIIETTVGRIILNDLFPKEIGFRNEVIGQKQLGEIVKDTIQLRGFERTARFLDEVKNIGFKYATKSGFSYGMGDLPILNKDVVLEDGDRKMVEIEDQYKEGLLTKKERYSQIIRVWSDVKDAVQRLSKDSLDTTGSVASMIDSGARGSLGQLTSVIGMKGLVSSPSGEIIELPIKSSLREGLDVLEYFIASHGARKGLTDTALRTANAGYLTRRLVDVAQDVIIQSEDCGDEEGVVLTAEESDEIGEPLLTRLFGRVLMKDIKDGRKILVKKGKIIDEEDVALLEGKDIQEAHVRSVLTCKLVRGLCQNCYGFDLAYNERVKLGTAVGIVAAQSIGEPGTQLTMRTFHSGGVAAADITQGLPRVEELFEARVPKRSALIAEVSGKVKIVEGEKRVLETAKGEKLIDTASGTKTIQIHHTAVKEELFPATKKAKITVKDGDAVKKGDVLVVKYAGDELKAHSAGTVKLDPKGVVLVYEEEDALEVPVPPNYRLIVKDGDEVERGEIMTEGQLNLQDLFRLKGQAAVMRYLLKEVLGIYASQGQKLNAKHIEIIVRQMFSRVFVDDVGGTELLPGQIIERSRAGVENDRATSEKGEPAILQPLFMGITKVALSTESFLSAASFMETTRVLVNAAVTGKMDTLDGLKENVIIGRLTPAGTGFGAALSSELETEVENIFEDRARQRAAEIAATETFGDTPAEELPPPPPAPAPDQEEV